MVTEKQWGKYVAKLNNKYLISCIHFIYIYINVYFIYISCIGSQDIDYSPVNCPAAFSAA